MDLPMDLGSFGAALKSGNEAVVHSRLSHIADRGHTSHRRVHRNAVLRSKMKTLSLPLEVQEFQATNPEAHGLPRAYKMSFNSILPGQDASALDGATVIFGQFGVESGGVIINDHVIDPKDVFYSVATNSYHIAGLATKPGEEKLPVTGLFDFNSVTPVGTFGVANTAFNVTLDPVPLKFKVQVSIDAGAYYSTGTSGLIWDPDSEAWVKASWDSAMEFAYDIKTKVDPVLGTLAYIENFFHDKATTATWDFSLTKDLYGTAYTSVMDSSVTTFGDGATLNTTVSDLSKIPAVTSARSQSNIRSVYPQRLAFEFSPFGNTFTGAYQDKDGTVYAVQAEVDLDTVNGLMSNLAQPSETLPVQNLFSFLDRVPSTSSEEISEDVHNQVVLRGHSRLGGKETAILTETTLLSCSPMIRDESDPTGYSDSIAKSSMKDFHDIITYYMDTDLRTTFISSTPIVLVPAVQAVALDDGKGGGAGPNSTFYKSLQVPYLAAYVASSTMAEGKNINGARADKLLRLLPTKSDVYERHASKLYRFRFLEKFGKIQDFLDDQKDSKNKATYESKINIIAQVMKSKLDAANFDGGKIAAKLDEIKKAKDAIDSLAAWAKDKQLYWAFRLLYYVEVSTIPNWYAQSTGGLINTASLGMSIKNLNGIFGMLEGDQVNPNGQNFMQAFNQAVELFQMTAIIPQMVDVEGNKVYFDTILKATLNQFYNDNKTSGNTTLNQAAKDAMTLYSDQQLRENFYQPLFTAQRLGRATGTWNHITQMWEDACVSAKWFKVLEGGSRLMTVMGGMATAVMMFMPLIAGGVGNLTPSAMVTWIASIAGVSTWVIGNLGFGAIRLVTLWSHIAGAGNCVKVLLGFDYVLDEILPKASQHVSSAFAKWFVRTSAEAAADQNMPLLLKMFGRNVGELVMTIAVVLLSIAIIVTTAIDLAIEQDKLMIAADALFLFSAVLQILTVACGWVAISISWAAATGSAAAATMCSALSICSAWGGPVGIVFAIIGVIIVIVALSIADRRNPIQKFVDDYVKPAGLYMDYLAVDYFTDIPATNKAAELVGVSISSGLIQPARVGNSDPTVQEATGAAKVFLGMDNNSPIIKFKPSLEYSNLDIFSISTDAYGNSLIATKVYGTDGSVDIYYLGSSGVNNHFTLRKLPAATDVDAYKRGLSLVQWTVTPLAQPTMAGTTGPTANAPASMLVSLKQNGLTLAIILNASNNQPSEFVLYNAMHGALPWPAVNAFWLTMQPMGPGTFAYSQNPWKLQIGETDLKLDHSFTPDNTSQGLEWRSVPSLPAPFQLVSAFGQTEGRIITAPGQKLSQTMNQTFNIRCSVGLGGKPVTRYSDLTIVVEAATPPAA